MPAEFNKLGISFLYPENWTLDEEDALSGREAVTVVSPGGAFWTVSVHPPSTDPDRLAIAAVDALKDEYGGLETHRALQTVAGRELTGYDLSFYYLDLTNTATIRCLRTTSATYAVFCQAEDREYEGAREVFLAMTTSLISNLSRF